jgi:hypothetical protein
VAVADGDAAAEGVGVVQRTESASASLLSELPTTLAFSKRGTSNAAEFGDTVGCVGADGVEGVENVIGVGAVFVDAADADVVFATQRTIAAVRARMRGEARRARAGLTVRRHCRRRVSFAVKA